MTLLSRQDLASDVWGGLASMLVALPASMAFGVAVFSALGPSFASQGAAYGILGAAAIGIVAPLVGGTERLVSAPCAPAAAVLGAFALDAASRQTPPERALQLLALVALASAALQLVYGAIGGGTLIKYIPYPVVTGYLSGVGVVIFLKQLPGLLGLPPGVGVWQGLATPDLWRGPALVVGLVTIAVMVLAPRVTRAVPAAILALLAGAAAYFALAQARPELLRLEGNPLVVGTIGGSLADAASARWAGLGAVRLADLALAAVPALTLSVLLSIDTLKTCVVVDALTRT
ncbi:MAG TPA: SulP family inorganic anion transporter, partial [Vicinamibacteria bacterium]|nr:SulP family inorganic anion transporter [Vicinamibacteria bacterium]